MAIFSASITCPSWATSLPGGTGVAHLQPRLRSRSRTEPPDQAGATGLLTALRDLPTASAACSWVNENSAIRR